MINIMYAVDPIKRIVKPMSGHAVTEQDHEASSLRFAFPDNIPGTGLESTGVAVRVMYIRPDGGDPVAKTLTFYKHSGGYYLYDWNLQKSDLQKEGRLVFSLCILNITEGEVSEWHTTPYQIRVLNTIHTDDSDEGDETITPTVAQRVAVLETMIQRVASGAPIVVSSVSAMTDTEQIYVLATDGYWYYYDGTAWAQGGKYGTMPTDTTLTQSDSPADAKVTGDKLNKKITMPSGGTEGQLLQYTGNGGTAWTSFGMPTDAQVESIFSDWLDDHPEATTTVEDFSLTANKLVKGTLGFVTLEQFGAAGDGETDDTEAIENAMAYAIDNGTAIVLLQKTYVLASKEIQFRLKEDQSLVMIGFGSKSVIKRKNDSLVDKYSRLFDIEIDPAMTAPAKDVIFSNFCIDSNRRGQSMATDGYDYDASADITITNGTGTFDKTYQYIDSVRFENMRFFDPVADHINISGGYNTNVKSISIVGMIATGRQSTRNDIGITGNPLGSVFVERANIGSIHVEYNAFPSDEDIADYFISNSEIGEMTIVGKLNLNVDNCLITNHFVFSANIKTKICNTTFLLTKLTENQFIYNPNEYESCITFDGCTFVSYYHAGHDATITSNCTRIYIRTGIDVLFQNCDFKYNGTLDYDADTDGVNDHIEGYPILCQVGSSNPVVINNCRISSVFVYGAVNYGNNLTIANMTIQNHHGVYVRLMANNNGNMCLRYDNVKFGDKCNAMMRIAALNDTRLAIYGEVDVLPQNFKVKFDSVAVRDRFSQYLVGDFRRIVHIDTPLDFALLKSIVPSNSAKTQFVMLKGDEFINIRDGLGASPYKWISEIAGLTETTSASGAGTGQTPLTNRFKVIGSGHGDTASRPICFLSKGFEYFDTDLGKPIYWNGTGWVDSSGVSVT